MDTLLPLGKGVNIFVSDNHHFTTDTILLADFSNPKNKDLCVDLGTGCGTIPLLWARDKSTKVLCVDIEPDALSLLQKSIEYNTENGIENAKNLTPLLCDIKEIKDKTEAEKYDLVVCNPPYKIDNSGIKNPNEQKATARHETKCSFDDICKGAARMLKFSGRFCICQRPERLTDIVMTLRKYRLEPKKLRFVQGKRDKSPKLFLLEAKKGANEGFLDVMPTLVVENDDGTFTEEMQKIYGAYKEEYQNG